MSPDIPQKESALASTAPPTRKKRLGRLCILLLVIATPIALLQRVHYPLTPFSYPAWTHKLTEPLMVPSRTPPPYIVPKLSAIAYNGDIWIGGEDGFFATSSDGGATWRLVDLSDVRTGKTPGRVMAIEWTIFSSGRMLTSDDTLFVTDDRGKSWKRFPTLDKTTQKTGWFLAGQEFASSPSGVKEVNPIGLICPQFTATLTTRNTTVSGPSPKCAVSYGRKIGWSVENPGGGNAVWEINGRTGKTRALTREFPVRAFGGQYKLPPPWYLFVLLPLAGLLLIAANRSGQIEVTGEPSIANRAISDRPLDWNDDDYLGFHTIARGISLFLRNRSTGAPLVLAISGAWGSGKSSLMNLLRANMRDVTQVIWFNAWHHQAEDQLLAALLQTVRTQVLASPFSVRGLWNRARMIAYRFREAWPLVPFLLVLLVVSVWLAILLLLNMHDVPTAPHALKWTAVGTAVVAALGSIKKLKDLVGNLIANPAALLASATGGADEKYLDAQTTFRERFAKDFSCVVEVIKPRRLVILIDDLDRCKPENIRGVLEAINYLMTSGECLIVLGMARMNVEYFLGYSFKDLVADMPFDLFPHGTAEMDAQAKRLQYAQMYLEKLIQIDVPVPTLVNQSARDFLAGSSESTALTADQAETLAWRKGREIWMKSRLQWLGRWGFPIVGSVLLLAVLWWPANLVLHEAMEQWTGTPPPILEVLPQPLSALSNSPDGAVDLNDTSAHLGGQASSTDVQTAQAGPSWPIYMALAFGLFMIVSTAIRLLLTTTEQLQVDDSPVFKEALNVWSPLILRNYRSPRGVKLYLNRVRFLAMRQRAVGEADPLSRLDKLARALVTLWPFPWKTRKERREKLANLGTVPPIRTQNLIAEDVLVALVSLQSESSLWTSFKRADAKPEKLASLIVSLELDDSGLMQRFVQVRWHELIDALAVYEELAGVVYVTM